MKFREVNREQPIPDIGQPKLSGMPIPKAIEILTDLTYHGIHADDQSIEDAHKLGIEALKVVREYHSYLTREGVVPLPGETEE